MEISRTIPKEETKKAEGDPGDPGEPVKMYGAYQTMPKGAKKPKYSPSKDKAPEHVEERLQEGSGGEMKKGPGLAKAGMSAAPGAAPTAPKAAMPKMPKPAMPKAAGTPKSTMPKTPSMGAGTPTMGKAYQDAAVPAGMQKDLTWDPKLKPTGAVPTPTFAPEPGVASLNPGKARSVHLPGGSRFGKPVANPNAGKGALPKGVHSSAPVAANVLSVESGSLPASTFKQPAVAAKPAATPPPMPVVAKKPARAAMGMAELKKEHIGFDKMKEKLSHQSGIDNPAAVAAAIGRKKFGAKGMAAKAKAGKK